MHDYFFNNCNISIHYPQLKMIVVYKFSIDSMIRRFTELYAITFVYYLFISIYNNMNFNVE